MPMSPTADDIASTVLRSFNSLPAKYKPRNRGDDIKEWVPLAGIVLYREGWPLTCASIGTGMKCLPKSKVSQSDGMVLHDWHAEIVAIRAFNRWLLDSCQSLSSTNSQEDPSRVSTPGTEASTWLQRSTSWPHTETVEPVFKIRDDVDIHMYCSEAPCGDASMELVMAAQQDATPWDVPNVQQPSAADDDHTSIHSPLKGRGFFSELGIVRRKPSRPDAPQTTSKSCTDKLAQTQFLSLLSSSTSLIINPSNAYLKSIVLPGSQHVPVAVERAFGKSGRLGPLCGSSAYDWNGQYHRKWFDVRSTSLEFEWSRRSIPLEKKVVPSNITAVYTPHFQEILIGGILQGRQQSDPKRASRICRRALLGAVTQVLIAAGNVSLGELLKGKSYDQLKNEEILKERRKVKDIVRGVMAPEGWVRNSGDEDWGQEV